LGLFEGIVRHRPPLRRGEVLYRAGDPFISIFVVRSGALESYHVSATGDREVDRFSLPGHVLGWNAINGERYPNSAVALDTSSVCEIPFARLASLMLRVPMLQRKVLRVMSRAITADHESLSVLAKRTAEERLAMLLVNLSESFQDLGYSAHRFRLPMTRTDLANHLGLVPETMSRLFGRFRDRGWIVAVGSEVVLRDLAALRQAASGS